MSQTTKYILYTLGILVIVAIIIAAIKKYNKPTNTALNGVAVNSTDQQVIAATAQYGLTLEEQTAFLKALRCLQSKGTIISTALLTDIVKSKFANSAVFNSLILLCGLTPGEATAAQSGNDKIISANA